MILFGRNRAPVGTAVRTVMGIKGEPSTPADPAMGLVWTAILKQVDEAGSESPFVSVADTDRPTFAKHPWSIGGGGAAELKAHIEDTAKKILANLARDIGITSVTGEDDVYLSVRRNDFVRLEVEPLQSLVIGDALRDWQINETLTAIWPYGEDYSLKSLRDIPKIFRYLWAFRASISKRKRFGTPMLEKGLTWYEFQELYTAKIAIPLSITFAEVATHNHFVLDRGGKVFKQTAPVIKLPAKATEADHLALLGLLNSSTACFWLQQVCHNKGGPGGGNSKDEKWHDFYQLNGKNVSRLPLVEPYPTDLATALDTLAQEFGRNLPAAVCAAGTPTKARLTAARTEATAARARMIALQEELDWRCYRLYGLLTDPVEYAGAPPELKLGERAFEIVMARKMAEGELETAWFERHRSTPITELPADWPDDYRRLVERRIELIESDAAIGLIERPEYKRRWALDPWEEMEQVALKLWLLDRLEEPRYWEHDGLISTNRLADLARTDADFMAVAELYTARADFDPNRLVGELVAAEAVPYLPVLRYSESGLRKRAEWEKTWDLQRREDAIDAAVAAAFTSPADATPEQAARRLAEEQKRRKAAEVGDIPVPPKYKREDFRANDFWRLRGGLDVPKERFISYPGAERAADGSLVVAWAGWTHLQQARALSGYFVDAKETEGWPAERLAPLLAGILDLVPWLKQWHNELDPTFNQRMGDYFADYVTEEARAIGYTPEGLKAWTPPVGATGVKRGRKRKVG